MTMIKNMEAFAVKKALAYMVWTKTRKLIL